MNRTTRDRDDEGRARSARPRDGLGRPLPYGAEGVPRQPEGVVRTPDETLREAQRLLDAGMPFHAHEVFEDAWKSGPETERDLWQGLAQLAVGLTHTVRGNREGGARLLRRGADRLANASGARGSDPDEGHGGHGGHEGHEGHGGHGGPYPSPYGIDVDGLVSWARELADRSDRADRADGPGEAGEAGESGEAGEAAESREVDAAAEAPRLRHVGTLRVRPAKPPPAGLVRAPVRTCGWPRGPWRP
ncbi:DUF309 domain-containing protein [Streptomyces sp. NPDC059352]|uniref:DUF309 domain-containing protein n=1 Tax=Streptomyces sp. NPDC059352 TaxID=3346810 RepID=UPI0036A386E3